MGHLTNQLGIWHFSTLYWGVFHIFTSTKATILSQAHNICFSIWSVWHLCLSVDPFFFPINRKVTTFLLDSSNTCHLHPAILHTHFIQCRVTRNWSLSDLTDRWEEGCMLDRLPVHYRGDRKNHTHTLTYTQLLCVDSQTVDLHVIKWKKEALSNSK